MTIRRAFHSISQIPNLIPGSAVKQHPLDISYPPDIHQQLDICHLDNRNQAVIRQQLDICHLDMCHLDICHLPDIHHPLDNYHWPDTSFSTKIRQMMRLVTDIQQILDICWMTDIRITDIQRMVDIQVKERYLLGKRYPLDDGYRSDNGYPADAVESVR